MRRAAPPYAATAVPLKQGSGCSKHACLPACWLCAGPWLPVTWGPQRVVASGAQAEPWLPRGCAGSLPAAPAAVASGKSPLRGQQGHAIEGRAMRALHGMIWPVHAPSHPSWMSPQQARPMGDRSNNSNNYDVQSIALHACLCTYLPERWRASPLLHG